MGRSGGEGHSRPAGVPEPQGFLNLTRLSWRLRRFRTGPRKSQTPYGLLGLNVPDLSFWEFLRMTPEESREKLSAQEDAA